MRQKVTIYDIAEAAGVSPATVSRYIHSPDIVSEKTKQRIHAAFSQYQIGPGDLAVKTNPQPTQARKKTASNPSVLVCISQWTNEFYYQVLEGIDEYLTQRHYRMIVCRETLRQDTLQEFLNDYASSNLCGIILFCPASEEILRQLYTGYPVVQCSEYNPFCPDIPHVIIDDYSAARQATAHLIEKGCTKLGFFSGRYELRYVQLRYRGFREMLEISHLTLDPKQVIIAGDYSYEKLLHAARIYFELSEQPDGIFAISDMHAHAVIRAALERGIRIPQDLKVFGIDNTPFAYLSSPGISTVAQPLWQIGTESARLLLEQIEHPGEPVESVTLPTELLLRGSTGD